MEIICERARDIITEVKDVTGFTVLFFEAAETEISLPSVRRQSVKSCWPDYAPDAELSYGYNETITRRAKATPHEITRYDMALEVGMLLGEYDRKLVWACAHSAVRRQRGPHWKKIGSMFGIHAATAKRQFNRAMLEVWYKTLTFTKLTKKGNN